MASSTRCTSWRLCRRRQMPSQSFCYMDGQVSSNHAMNAAPRSHLISITGSPLEFLDLLDQAKAKYSDSDLPYTFIVPSLPGYGFSNSSSKKVLGTCESMAFVVDQLMAGLGFGNRYVAQGGDIGVFHLTIRATSKSSQLPQKVVLSLGSLQLDTEPRLHTVSRTVQSTKTSSTNAFKSTLL